jgi:hypothetical protein
MDQISKLIEDEIEKRVNERINIMLDKISRTYDISLRQLMRDLDTMADTPSTCCKGLTGKGKRCSRSAKTDGYCHLHIKQKPVQRITRTPSSVTPTLAVAHTHTLPPLFMAGCPACERSRSTNNLSLLAMCA